MNDPGDPLDEDSGGIAAFAENVVEGLRAVALGVRDTAHDMVREGRRGARDAYAEGWRRFESKTRSRRKSG
jgi:hypothetical protein